ncbi:hypothetical protein RIF29_31787 [Crotalaria pallida]|uniref:BHLH domain-containing protein n=1 Tax=Crotalaria pallida TaxID=3830 RepID=A0AAN9EHJ8_CROPI
MDIHQETLEAHINDFELHDFLDYPNFDQFIDLIRGEENEEDGICNFDSDLINGCFIDNPLLFSSPAEDPFDHRGTSSNALNNVYDRPTASTTLTSFSCFDGEVKLGGSEENEEYSTSATTTTTTRANAKPMPKTDRSKTLISERRRRDRMKDKLLALRSLVPNITKMDKASIIGDAVSYVHELQAQANKLKAEVSGLEESLLVSENYHGSIQNPITSINYVPICKKIIQMDMFQVDEKGFYVKIVCNKGKGVAASLYRSLESLIGFNVHNSNLATVSDNFQLTFLLNVKGSVPKINIPNLKLWVAGAFLNQGFEFIPSFKL